MAILPRTLLTQPAPAAVAAVTLFGLTVMGTTAWKTAQSQRLQMDEAAVPCAGVIDSLGPQEAWTHTSYVRLAYCYDLQDQSEEIVSLAARGLQKFPASETLYNLKGYHELQLTRHTDAVETLETGLAVVGEPSDGIMENNLAWSYLFVGEGDSEEARRLYQRSLEREPNACETVHTGIFVEFEIARSSDTVGIAKAEALRNLQSLRRAYRHCENRDAEWGTAVEAVGAAVVYRKVDEMLVETDRSDSLMRTAVETNPRLLNVDFYSLCKEEAMPMADLHGECVGQLIDAETAVKGNVRFVPTIAD